MLAREDEAADWHEMLDRLVMTRGGPAELAAAICKKTGRNSARDFETAKRNLANWVAGRSVPQHRNFQLLTELLKVASDPESLARWNALYGKARLDPAEAAPSPAASRSLPGQRLGWRLAGGILAAVVGATGAIGYWAWSAGADDSRTIGFRPYTELGVGESTLVQARRGACGQQPPAWREIEHEIPKLTVGRLVDDGIGTSLSDACGGPTPGRLVRFVAERPGVEIFELFQRRLKIVVRDGGKS